MKKTSMTRIMNLNTLVMLFVTLLVMVVLSNERSYADDSYVSTATIRVAESCSITSTLDTPHIASLPAGIYSGNYNSDGHDYRNGIGKTTIKAFCNDSAGFSIYAVGFTNDSFGNNTLVGPDNNTIVTGTGTSGETSNWAMKIGTVAGTYAPTLENGYGSFKAVPSTYDKVASFNSVTDLTNGSSITTTYAAYIASTQAPGTYNGKVKYTLVHPVDETPVQPQPSTAGCINYFANAPTALGTMGCQSTDDDGNTLADGATVTLLASNFSRTGYGFAGWSDKYDYATNASANFYGPNETITAPTGTTANGLSLYAVWVKSAGNLQGWNGCSNLTPANTATNILRQSITALSDSRDDNTYAVAKLADGKCWMIENLRLDNSATLTIANTNKPLNDGTNVTLKHNYADTTTSNTLSPTSSVAYDASTAPDGWCTTNSAACDDQSRIRTDNTANRASNPTTNSGSMYSYGNYYNWYSATAGRGTFGFSTNNNSVAGDLCPAGWRLPKGGNKTRIEASDDNEFWNLTVDALNGGVTPANYSSSTTTPYYTGTAEAGPVDKKLRSYPNNYLYSGYVNGGSLNDRGSYGYFWSSTANSTYYAYSLRLNSSNVTPGTYSVSKYFGRSVRCIAGS